MSVGDELRELERRVAGRMKELRPLVDEYRDLERVACRLGLDGAGSARAATAATGKQRHDPNPRRRGATGDRTLGRAAPGARGQAVCGRSGRRARSQVLEAVKQQPGITVREIGERLGVDSTSLYRHVRALQADGQINKRGRTPQPG